MKELNYPWLMPAWAQLLAMRDRLPHALLISGPQGVGKRALAEHHAQALLCEAPDPTGNPCGTCGACRWFGDGNHPDFRSLIPEILRPEADVAEEGGTDIAPDATGSKARAPSKVIKIGQVRALDSFFNVGTHRAGRRVLLVYPADTLTPDAGNALLKTLEEPPAATFFLLVTSQVNQVLPTIRSRASRLVVARPPQAEVHAWLAAQGVADPPLALANAGGAPLDAAGEDPQAGFREVLIGALAGARPIDPVALAEKCEKAGAAKLAEWMSRWISDLLVRSAGGPIRYHPGQAQAIDTIAARTPAAALHAYNRQVMRIRRSAEHPLNARLYAEALLIDYARVVAIRN